jgi:hypothetical protein
VVHYVFTALRIEGSGFLLRLVEVTESGVSSSCGAAIFVDKGHVGRVALHDQIVESVVNVRSKVSITGEVGFFSVSVIVRVERARSSGISVNNVAGVVHERDGLNARGGESVFTEGKVGGDVLVQFERLMFCFVFDFHSEAESIILRLEHVFAFFLGREELLGAAVAVEVGINVGLEGLFRIRFIRHESLPFFLYTKETFCKVIADGVEGHCWDTRYVD